MEDFPAQFCVKPIGHLAAIRHTRANRWHQGSGLAFRAHTTEPRTRIPILGGHDPGGPFALSHFPTANGAQRNAATRGIPSVQLLTFRKTPLHVEVPMLVYAVFYGSIHQPLLVPGRTLGPTVFPLQGPRPGFIQRLAHARTHPTLSVGVLAACRKGKSRKSQKYEAAHGAQMSL